MMDEGMTKGQHAAFLIDEYAMLQRIKAAPDRDEEINYQIRITKVKLETFGIAAENLEL